jgi:hypothetical protein
MCSDFGVRLALYINDTYNTPDRHPLQYKCQFIAASQLLALAALLTQFYLSRSLAAY